MPAYTAGRKKPVARPATRASATISPALGNFLFADVGDGRGLFDQLLGQGVIVRPLEAFGAPEAIRVTVGTADENSAFADALGHVLSGVSS